MLGLWGILIVSKYFTKFCSLFYEEDYNFFDDLKC